MFVCHLKVAHVTELLMSRRTDDVPAGDTASAVGNTKVSGRLGDSRYGYRCGTSSYVPYY